MAVQRNKQHPMVGTDVHAFRAYLAAYQLLSDLKRTHSGRRVRLLDVGGSHGVHARFFRQHGIEVDLVDMVAGDERPVFVGDYLDFRPERPYDVIWSSHVLEHVRNVGLFIDKMAQDLVANGYCVASVPPIRGGRMAFNHLSFWNPGMLLLNFGMSGFDMKTARLAQYGYNVSIIARLAESVPENIKDGFPPSLVLSNLHFNGNLSFHNWGKKLQKYRSAMPLAATVFGSHEEAEESMARDGAGLFCLIASGEKKLLHYMDNGHLIRVK